MIKVGVVGLGKMGLSHLAMMNASPDVEVVGVCDQQGYVLNLLSKYTGLRTWTSLASMLQEVEMAALVIATPSSSHANMVHMALDRGVHVFCEKPLCLDPRDSTELARLAEARHLVTQVGYHNRYVATFSEVKRLLDASAVGQVSHVLAEAYGPVVLRKPNGTWRNRRQDGGGALFDYGAHPLNLLNWYLGEADRATGTWLNKVFSTQVDDEVFSTLIFPSGASAQLSVNWSDESQRKMTTKLSIWGTDGRIDVDRQECHVYLRSGTPRVVDGYHPGWNIRYTTDLTQPVDFYLRGEEYSAQLEDFLSRIRTGRLDGRSTFASAAATDRTIAQLMSDSRVKQVEQVGSVAPAEPQTRHRAMITWLRAATKQLRGS